MEVSSISPIVLVLLVACSAKEEVGYYPTGQIEFRAPLDEHGVYNGLCTYFYKTGAKKVELPFTDHYINGLVKRYYPSGRIMSTAIYKNGQQWGEVKSYYPSGEIRSRGYVYGKISQGPMRYFYRNGELQHLRIYDSIGKISDFAEFDSAGTVDKRYTQPLIYAMHDSAEVNKKFDFEIILASRISADVSVKINSTETKIDSTVGLHSRLKYTTIFRKTGKKCLSGMIYQHEHHGDTIVTTSFPWIHCFYVVSPGRRRPL